MNAARILRFSVTVLAAPHLRPRGKDYRVQCAAGGCEEPARNKRRVLDSILHFFRSLYDPDGLRELIRWGGAPLVCVIVFVETGFFVGFFLPGDSLLVTAGIFAAADVLSLRWLLLPGMACAIVGDQIG